MGKEPRTRDAKLTPADLRAAERLRALWASKPDHVTQETVAGLMGNITQGAVSQYMTSRARINMKALMAFAKALGVPPEAIRDDLPEQRLMSSSDQTEWVDIESYNAQVGLGGGIESPEYVETSKLKFRAQSLRRKRLNPERLKVLYGRGESMLPRIRTGDAIMFDTSDTEPRDDAIFVIEYPGVKAMDVSAKRCQNLGGMWFFDALNPDGDPEWRKAKRKDDERRPIKILGRVRWIASWED